MERKLESIVDECESEMSRAEHRKKIATMDYHTSEENHQEGRWHCANDLREFTEKALNEVLNYKPTMIVGEERSDEEGV